jgi:hypothetical protein
MIKPTPNPPETDLTSPYESLDSKSSTTPPSAPSTTTSAHPAPRHHRVKPAGCTP